MKKIICQVGRKINVEIKDPKSYLIGQIFWIYIKPQCFVNKEYILLIVGGVTNTEMGRTRMNPVRARNSDTSKIIYTAYEALI